MATSIRLVNVIVGDKAWNVSSKIANEMINMAKKKLSGNNAIVAVEHENTIIMLKYVYETEKELAKAKATWEGRGCKCYFTIKSKSKK